MTAAFSRVNFAVVSRADRGGNAVKAAAYNAAARYEHGDRTYDFRRKASEHSNHAVMLPSGAPPSYADAATLWRAAEASERRCDAQVARQVLISIPREVPAADRLAYAQAIVAPWVAEGAVAQIDVHCPQAADGGEQPHAHVLLSMRRVTDAGFAAKKERAWNQQFREGDGRAERARIEERGNAWMASHAVDAHLDLRSLAARGSRRTPEPQAIRSEWQRWQREGGDPTQAPASVARTLEHRARRAALAEAVAAEQRAAAEIANLQRAMAALDYATSPPRTRTRQTTRRPAATWHLAGGGYDALPAAQQTVAADSYRRWQARRLAGARPVNLAAYVAYVQDRSPERSADAPDQIPAPKVAASNGISAVGDAGRSRRAQHLASVLRAYYGTGWLPPTVVARLDRVIIDATARTATLHLRDGTAIVDHGDRIIITGTTTDAAIAEMAAAAARHGWPAVALTGTVDFRDRSAIAMGLLQPPIATDHVLSPSAQARLRTALAVRATAALVPLDRVALARQAATDPVAAARMMLEIEHARTAAALAGRPTGETDPHALARPREAAITAARDTAVRSAVEAIAAADAHRREHGTTTRLFDAAVRRRQAALDADAGRLGRLASTLDSHHERDRLAVGVAAIRAARANRAGLQDWEWSPSIQAATAHAAAIDRVRKAVAAGDYDVILATANGNIDAAIAATQAHAVQRQRDQAAAMATTAHPAALAVAASLAAERAAGTDAARLAAARAVTAAVLAGDRDVILSVERGHLAEAERLAVDRQRQRDRAAAEARRVAMMAAAAEREHDVTLAPGPR